MFKKIKEIRYVYYKNALILFYFN